MTDEQINETLARAMGLVWRPPGYLPPSAVAHAWPPGWNKGGKGYCDAVDFNPATSRDAIHKHVVPVLRERGLMEAWAKAVGRAVEAEEIEEGHASGYDCGVTYAGVAACLTAPPRTLCEAAIAVLKGNSDE